MSVSHGVSHPLGADEVGRISFRQSSSGRPKPGNAGRSAGLRSPRPLDLRSRRAGRLGQRDMRHVRMHFHTDVGKMIGLIPQCNGMVDPNPQIRGRTRHEGTPQSKRRALQPDAARLPSCPRSRALNYLSGRAPRP